MNEDHATLVERIARNAGHVMSTLLSTQETGPLPTVEPPCLQYPRSLSSQVGAELSWALTRPSPIYSVSPAPLASRGNGTKKRRRLQRKHERSLSRSGGEVEDEATESKMERISRIRLADVEDAVHLKYVSKNITALREMLGRDMLGDKKWLMGLGVLSVRERRKVDSARSRGSYGRDPATECTTGRSCGGMLPHGNLIVRELARSLLRSLRKRFEESLLQTAFLKWKVRWFCLDLRQALGRFPSRDIAFALDL